MNPETKLILDAINALAKNTIPPAEYNSYLVSSGQTKPQAPKGPEVAADPGKWHGTAYDPLQSYVHRSAVVNFASPGKEDAFMGGTGPVTEWFKVDKEAFDRWFLANFGAPLNYEKLHPAQRAAMNI